MERELALSLVRHAAAHLQTVQTKYALEHPTCRTASMDLMSALREMRKTTDSKQSRPGRAAGVQVGKFTAKEGRKLDTASTDSQHIWDWAMSLHESIRQNNWGDDASFRTAVSRTLDPVMANALSTYEHGHNVVLVGNALLQFVVLKFFELKDLTGTDYSTAFRQVTKRSTEAYVAFWTRVQYIGQLMGQPPRAVAQQFKNNVPQSMKQMMALASSKKMDELAVLLDMGVQSAAPSSSASRSSGGNGVTARINALHAQLEQVTRKQEHHQKRLEDTAQRGRRYRPPEGSCLLCDQLGHAIESCTTLCSRCRRAHEVQTCTLPPDIKCHKCQKIGHLQWACPTRLQELRVLGRSVDPFAPSQPARYGKRRQANVNLMSQQVPTDFRGASVGETTTLGTNDEE